MGDDAGTLQIEHDDITLETKPKLTRFGGTFGKLKFAEFFFNTFCFTPYWHYRPTYAFHADNPGVYTSEKLYI